MSKGLELFNIYVGTFNPDFFVSYGISKEVGFCGTTMCGDCLVYSIRGDTPCQITKEEFQVLGITNPEYMI